jgi:hypothetical protein
MRHQFTFEEEARLPGFRLKPLGIFAVLGHPAIDAQAKHQGVVVFPRQGDQAFVTLGLFHGD